MGNMIDVFRQEKKYGLSLIEARKVSYRLGQVLEKDIHGGNDGGYIVRSLYFDTLNDADYYDKVDGYDNRQKLRLRSYGPDFNTARLELKEKMGNNQRKRGVLLDKEAAEKVINGEYDCLLHIDNPFAAKLYQLMCEKAYFPKCIVEYDREAFIVPTNDIRITLDSGIRASEVNLNLFEPNLQLANVEDPNNVTLEIKYNHFLLSYVKDLLSTHEYMQISASKYCIARSLVLRGER
ncbi:MAG: polyphosphate polymerase domain-containing protein [Lachnospiraceae bacterium]